MFQIPQYRPIMQLPQTGQMQRQQQASMPNPLMQPPPVQPNPMDAAKQGLQAGKDIGGMINPPPNPLGSPAQPNPLLGSAQNPAASNDAANSAYTQLENQEKTQPTINSLPNFGNIQAPDWWMRNFGTGLF